MDKITESQIRNYYVEILNREPDLKGLSYFVNLVEKGKISLDDVKKQIINSPEAQIIKSATFLQNAPIFKTAYSDNEIRKMIDAVPYWHHYFKLGNVETPTENSLNHQMWMAQGIPLDLTGKSVLDIGTWDGFYSFLCEKRGASRVLAIDSLQHNFSKESKPGSQGFHVAKKILNSNVDYKIMNVYDLDKLDETFDIVLFFGVYYHLDNPVLALRKIFSKAKETVLLTGHVIDSPEPVMCYYGEYEMNPKDASNWWVASPQCILKIANRIGWSESKMLDERFFDVVHQTSEMKNSIRHLGKVGIFKFSK